MRGVLAVVLLLLVAGFVLGGEDDVPPPSDVAEAVVQVAPETSVSLDGGGGMSSDPFVLDAGDYRVGWTASGGCYYGFDLKPLDGQGRSRRVSAGDATEGSDNVYDVEAGRWYLEVFSGPAPGCPWTWTLVPR